jgi:hypothetical protein
VGGGRTGNWAYIFCHAGTARNNFVNSVKSIIAHPTGPGTELTSTSSPYMVDPPETVAQHDQPAPGEPIGTSKTADRVSRVRGQSTKGVADYSADTAGTGPTNYFVKRHQARRQEHRLFTSPQAYNNWYDVSGGISRLPQGTSTSNWRKPPGSAELGNSPLQTSPVCLGDKTADGECWRPHLCRRDLPITTVPDVIAQFQTVGWADNNYPPEGLHDVGTVTGDSLKRQKPISNACTQ